MRGFFDLFRGPPKKPSAPIIEREASEESISAATATATPTYNAPPGSVLADFWRNLYAMHFSNGGMTEPDLMQMAREVYATHPQPLPNDTFFNIWRSSSVPIATEIANRLHTQYFELWTIKGNKPKELSAPQYLFVPISALEHAIVHPEFDWKLDHLTIGIQRAYTHFNPLQEFTPIAIESNIGGSQSLPFKFSYSFNKTDEGMEILTTKEKFVASYRIGEEQSEWKYAIKYKTGEFKIGSYAYICQVMSQDFEKLQLLSTINYSTTLDQNEQPINSESETIHIDLHETLYIPPSIVKHNQPLTPQFSEYQNSHTKIEFASLFEQQIAPQTPHTIQHNAENSTTTFQMIDPSNPIRIDIQQKTEGDISTLSFSLSSPLAEQAKIALSTLGRYYWQYDDFQEQLRTSYQQLLSATLEYCLKNEEEAVMTIPQSQDDSQNMINLKMEIFTQEFQKIKAQFEEKNKEQASQNSEENVDFPLSCDAIAQDKKLSAQKRT